MERLQGQRSSGEILFARLNHVLWWLTGPPQVKFYDFTPNAWQVWRLISTEVEGTGTPYERFGLDPLPQYNENEHMRFPAHVRREELERDDFGTVVTEVTTVTTSTRRRYRVEDA